MALRPLGFVKEIVESVGMEISYAYEDLVFMVHNGFLLQFTDDAAEVLIHVNSEADRSQMLKDIESLKKAALNYNLIFRDGTTYTVSQADDENIRIEFS